MSMKSRAERNENEIPTARPDSLNANALTKKAARNPESIADGGCAGRTDGRTGGRGHSGAGVSRARVRTGTRTMKRAKTRLLSSY